MMTKKTLFFSKLVIAGILFIFSRGKAEEINTIICPTSYNNARNTEGDLISLHDGRIFLAYSRFGGEPDDNGGASIYGMYSEDFGRTWSEPECIFKNDAGMNLMSVSLVRLAWNKLMIGYLRKNAENDCRYFVRISGDETRSWEPEISVMKEKNYYVVNNDRILRLSSGRILVPASNHGDYREGKPSTGEIFYSDDDGATWAESPEHVELPGIGIQEPGVVELADGSIFMILRNSLGTIYAVTSATGGATWGEPFSTGLVSPVAPASVARIPSTGDLLMIFNNDAKRRVPLTAAVSRDEGKSWQVMRDLETNGLNFAYTSITFVKNEVFLTYWTMLREESWQRGKFEIALKLRILPVSWFYE